MGNAISAVVAGGSATAPHSVSVARLKDGSELPFGLMVWSAGLKPVRFIEEGTPGLERGGPGGRLSVDDYLRVTGGGGRVFALGDCASHWERPLPATANVAEQQGAYLAKCFNEHCKTFIGLSRSFPLTFALLCSTRRSRWLTPLRPSFLPSLRPFYKQKTISTIRELQPMKTTRLHCQTLHCRFRAQCIPLPCRFLSWSPSTVCGRQSRNFATSSAEVWPQWEWGKGLWT